MAEQPQPVTVPLGAYVPQRMYEQLREAAREQDRSMSSLIRRALEHELQREAEQVAS
jgi:predicted transcriptional regulator